MICARAKNLNFEVIKSRNNIQIICKFNFLLRNVVKWSDTL